jgi:hypothetical protein
VEGTHYLNIECEKCKPGEYSLNGFCVKCVCIFIIFFYFLMFNFFFDLWC